MKFIHLECLRTWVRQRVDIKERMGSTLISWKTLNCELCKTPFPFAVYFNGKIYELLNYKLPAAPYIIFEHYSKESAESNGICIVSFAIRKMLRVGRHNDNEIRLSDVSVSRHHAALSWSFGAAYIQDSESKFGTLVAFNKQHCIIPEKPFTMQCGRTLLEFSIEQSWSIFGCCGTTNEVKQENKGEEENKINPQNCLPGSGKHNILVIKKKAYQRLLRTEEKLRRGETPSPSKKTEIVCKTPPPEENGPNFLHRQRTMAQPLIRRVVVRVREDNYVLEHRGDNADDIDDQDCQ